MSAPSSRPVEWPTLGMILLTYSVFGLALAQWQNAPWIWGIILGIAIAQFSSLQHEVLHGHPFRQDWLNEILVFPALMLVIPYRRFKETHLAHHHDPNLTDPYDDPESNYLEPKVWARMPRMVQHLLRLNNTLAGRFILGPVIGIFAFLRGEISHLIAGDRKVWSAWGLNLLGLLPLIWALQVTQMSFWAYLGAVYLGLALLRLRTFLEHRAHAQHRARTVIIEDRGPFALLFLNNNLHVVHHMHPQVPWYDLPALYAARKDHFQRRNEGYVYRNYWQIMRKYLWHAKDPVSHPIWPVNKDL